MAKLLLDLLLILALAKLGAELAERVKVPAVIGEIVAGLILGPSLLDWVELNETIRLLAELGVILLLLQVGMEMDVGEMRKVGGSAVGVAVVGVLVPMGLGYGLTLAAGHSSEQALFIGAALAATSVGITARAFGDLRILSTVEARVVLGAAVVDDVLVLIVLTVVVRIVEEGGVAPLDALVLIVVAVGFLLVTTVVSLRVVPPAFAWLARVARGSGTVLTAALVLTLGLALLAHEAQLAVIIGAFVAGLALGRTRQADRIERDLNPLAAFFVPVFFVSVGLEIDLGKILSGDVLLFAGILTVAAIVGKLVAGLVARGGSAAERVDRLLVGLGMVPRGEVGLIFASIGLTAGVLTDELYADLLLVVLLTTVVTPPAIRARIVGRRRAERQAARAAVQEPPGGWLEMGGEQVSLAAAPPPAVSLAVALEAATAVAAHDPDPELVEWMASLGEPAIDEGPPGQAAPAWDDAARGRLAGLLAGGDRRSWRLLDATGILAAALPRMADEIDHRRHDTTLLDPAHLLRLPVVEHLQELTAADGDPRARQELALLEDPDVLWWAALALDLSTDYEEPGVCAADLATDLDLPPAQAGQVTDSAADAVILRSAVAHVPIAADGLDDAVVRRIATADRARRIYLLGLALGELPESHRDALEELYVELLTRLAG